MSKAQWEELSVFTPVVPSDSANGQECATKYSALVKCNGLGHSSSYLLEPKMLSELLNV